VNLDYSSPASERMIQLARPESIDWIEFTVSSYLFGKVLPMNKYVPFTYNPEKSIEVLNITEVFFQNYPSVKERIEELSWIYQIIGKTVPHTIENLWSGLNETTRSDN
jgi:hypothetical protein